jgi:AmiR/NasT family two-component response regulator
VSIDGHNGVAAGERVQELLEELQVRNGQLERALQSRVLIEQAKGVLSERYEIGIDEAFELLRLAARSSRTRIHHLAAEIITSRTSPDAIELERAKPLGYA